MGEFLKAIGRYAKGILYLDPPISRSVMTEDLSLSEKYPKVHEWGVDAEGYFFFRKKVVIDEVMSEDQGNGDYDEFDVIYVVHGWRPIRASRVPQEIKDVLSVKNSADAPETLRGLEKCIELKKLSDGSDSL